MKIGTLQESHAQIVRNPGCLKFLVRMPWSSYRLGPKLMTLGKVYENTDTVVTISRPIMRELAHTTGESVALFSLNGEIAFCLTREFGRSRLVFAIQAGGSMHLHASAAGGILLAYGPEELREKILNVQQLSSSLHKLSDPQRIKDELSAIKRRGFAVNRGEHELEVAAIAAPIFDQDNKLECALAGSRTSTTIFT